VKGETSDIDTHEQFSTGINAETVK